MNLQDSEGGRTHVVSVGRIGEAICVMDGEEKYALALSKESLAACCGRLGLGGLGEIRALTMRESERRTGTGGAGPSIARRSRRSRGTSLMKRRRMILIRLRRRRRRRIIPVLRIRNISNSKFFG